jgi:hypothetical protein
MATARRSLSSSVGEGTPASVVSPSFIPERRKAERRVFELPPQDNNPGRRLGDQKKIFLAFVASFLGLTPDKIIGLQSCFNLPGKEDQILFSGPRGSTLAVPISCLLMVAEDARICVEARIAGAEAAFQPKAAETKKGSWRLS